MAYWLVVLGDAEGLRWVLANKRMAFTAARRGLASEIEPDDRLALYVGRGAYHNPTRDQSQLIAVATARTKVKDLQNPIEIAGRKFVCACGLRFDVVLAERQGVPIKSLVPRLSFVHRQDVWGQYFRSSLIRLGKPDFQVIDRAVKAALGSSQGGRDG